MNRSTHTLRRMAAVLLAAFVVAGIAPAAHADRHDRDRDADRHVRYKDAGRGREPRDGGHDYRAPGATYIVRRSSAGPAIAGFLGGLFLGATLAHHAPDGYAYYDPYCHEDFATLEGYRAHLHHTHHPGVVRVIELDNGDCVRTYHDQHGHWVDGDDRDWDDD